MRLIEYIFRRQAGSQVEGEREREERPFSKPLIFAPVADRESSRNQNETSVKIRPINKYLDSITVCVRIPQ